MPNIKKRKSGQKKQDKSWKAKAKKRAKVSNQGHAKKKAEKSAKRQLKKPIKISPAPKGKAAFKKEIMKRLLKEKEKLLAEVSQKVKEESNPIKFEMGDIYDIASIERDRELSLILGDRDREKLANIKDVLERLKDGTYGLCEECGEPIGEERLKILPFTKVCVECKTKNEKEHGAKKRYEEETGFAMIEKTEMEEEF